MKDIKLACCNFISDPIELKALAVEHGFEGVDWSLSFEDLGPVPGARDVLAENLAVLAPLEVRFHGPFHRTDWGHVDRDKGLEALEALHRAVSLVASVGGRFLTVHVGLGRDSTGNLSWESTVSGLSELAAHAHEAGITLCLENLAWGWTSRPDLFERMIRKTGCFVTLDIGHAIVSPAISSGQFQIEDFVTPHPDRVRNAHVYDQEDGDRHLPPRDETDLRDRLRLLQRLMECDWWVLELREMKALLQALEAVRRFMGR
ncbi:MAG: sugar phosphate isomerase/epimerase [Proteobacteria bacterium]|nr:sugar phosphate isomerase/epimerase [Pseudomonadota bacterium]